MAHDWLGEILKMFLRGKLFNKTDPSVLNGPFSQQNLLGLQVWLELGTNKGDTGSYTNNKEPFL